MISPNTLQTGRSGFLKSNAELIGIAIRFTDLTIIVIGALFANYFRFDSIDLDIGYKIGLLVALFGAATLFPLFDLYKPWQGMNILSEVSKLLFSWLIIICILLTLVYLTKTSDLYSRIWLGYWILITTCLFVASRFAIIELSKWARDRGFNTNNILIVGAGELGQKVCLNLQRSKWTGINVVGFLDDSPALHGTVIQDVPVIGGTQRINELVGKAPAGQLYSEQFEFDMDSVDQVWVSLPVSDKDKILEVTSILENSAIDIIFVPDLFLHGLLNHSVDDLAGMPVVNLRASPIEGTASTIKLIEDMVVASLAIVLAAPLMMVIAIGIKLESPGPVIFKQRRYGFQGKEFVVWKFRTMRVMEDGTEVTQAKKNDPRTTKLGAVLRKLSLDEIPQFFNVLQGRMSVVGPRPHAVAHNEEYRKIVDKYMWRFKVKPGITGWAQVNGWRGETDEIEKMEKRVEYDLEYLSNWDVWLDLKILVKTVTVVFSNNDVY